MIIVNRFQLFRGNTTFLSLLFRLVLPAVLFSCAGQIPPGGGPPDTDPPRIVRTLPDSAAVGVHTERIVLEFNEYVDRRSVEESVFISPFVGQLEFDWSGREVEIRFSEPLRKERTYVLNIGTDVVDVRARNRMASAFTLAFSTGDKIDQGAIRGRVFDEKPEGVMMFLFALDGIDPDTLDPSRARPDYITQTGKEGSFFFTNIAWGTYRIMAVRDEYRNMIYDRQVDQFGMTTSDITLSEQRPWVADVWFRMTAEDTTKPFLSRVQPMNSTQLQLRFSEPLDTATFRSAVFTLRDTFSNNSLPVWLAVLLPSDSTLAIIVTESPLETLRGYEIRVNGVYDRAGNPIDTLNNALRFVGVNTSDTVKPRFSLFGISDSARDVHVLQRFELRLSEPVLEGPAGRGLRLLDSSGVPVAATLRWSNPAGAVLSPDNPLHSAAWYRVQIPGDSLIDFAGNSYKDSTIAIHFRTIDLRSTGSVEGTIVDLDTMARGAVYLTAAGISGARAHRRTISLREPSPFLFDQLPEGSYTLDGFRDRDSSGTYSYGSPFPFIPAECFTVYNDTLKVRARWSVEGVNLLFR